MIGGRQVTNVTRAQAQELLDAAEGEFSAAGIPVKLGKNGKAGRKPVAR